MFEKSVPSNTTTYLSTICSRKCCSVGYVAINNTLPLEATCAVTYSRSLINLVLPLSFEKAFVFLFTSYFEQNTPTSFLMSNGTNWPKFGKDIIGAL